jgi:hypothetical protein
MKKVMRDQMPLLKQAELKTKEMHGSGIQMNEQYQDHKDQFEYLFDHYSR